MWEIDAHEKENNQNLDSISIGGGRTFPKKYTPTALKLFGKQIKYINSWLKTSERNYTWHLIGYEDRTNKISEKNE